MPSYKQIYSYHKNEFGLTPTGSPFTWQNTFQHPVTLTFSGNNATSISFSRDGVSFEEIFEEQGSLLLSPNDYMKLIYPGSAPDVCIIPR